MEQEGRDELHRVASAARRHARRAPPLAPELTGQHTRGQASAEGREWKEVVQNTGSGRRVVNVTW